MQLEITSLCSFLFKGIEKMHLRFFQRIHLVDILEKLVPGETSPAAVSTMRERVQCRGELKCTV